MKSSAQLAYETYCATRQWKSFDEKPLPQWDDCRSDIQFGWIKAARVVNNRAVYEASRIWTGVIAALATVLALVTLLVILFTFSQSNFLVALAVVSVATAAGALYGNWYCKGQIHECTK